MRSSPARVCMPMPLPEVAPAIRRGTRGVSPCREVRGARRRSRRTRRAAEPFLHG
ncbi:hypothetical protein SFC43_13850 [Bacteroides sp. CR5/BHMF/2]|nr:hypothetical protein [Bacteroides sp. CR5/BHMF/2]